MTLGAKGQRGFMRFFSSDKCIHTRWNYFGYQAARYATAKIVRNLSRKRNGNWRKLDRDGVLIIPDFFSEADLKTVKSFFIENNFLYLGVDSSFVDGDMTIKRRTITPMNMDADSAVCINKILAATTEVLGVNMDGCSELPIWVDKISGKPGDCSQTELHSDTFHDAFKVWFFPNGVKEEDMPMKYCIGSQRFSFRRLMFEWMRSMMARNGDELSWRVKNAPIMRPLVQNEIGCVCAPNTVVIANVHGFHCRSAATQECNRWQLHFSVPRKAF